MPSLGQIFGDWSLAPVPMLLAVVALALYGWAALRRVRRWPVARTLAFAGGVCAVVFALGSGLDRYGETLLSVHMVQHLVLTLVAPPLLLIGRPLELALRCGVRGALTRVRIPPLLGWSAFAIVMLGSHAPPLYDAAVRHPLLHELEHALYLGSALLFWWPLLDPRGRLGMVGRLLYAILAMPSMAVVGVVLSQARHPVYSVYPGLADQARAGAIMWVVGSALMASAVLVIAWLALAQEERRARRREAYEDAELPV